MNEYVGQTHKATSYIFFCYDSLKSASFAEIWEGSVIPTSSFVCPPAPMKGSDLFYAFSYTNAISL